VIYTYKPAGIAIVFTDGKVSKIGPRPADVFLLSKIFSLTYQYCSKNLMILQDF
jgi:hypothetical protein